MPARRFLLLPVPFWWSCGGPPPDFSSERGAEAQETLVQPLVPTPPGPRLHELVATIRADRRQFERRGDGVLGAHIAGVLRAELAADGLRARSGLDALALRTSAVGDRLLDRRPPTLGACAPTSETVGTRCAPAAELHHVGLTEWWTSAPAGVRQGWIVAAAPEPGADTLALRVSVDVGAVVSIDPDGTGATLRGSTGNLWRYEQLAAWDADGTVLPAHLTADAADLLVTVGVSGARWPVTVDPLLGPALTSETKLLASDGAASDELGGAVAVAGDLDGDGYDDLVVGASCDSDAGSCSGSADVYYGSASGIDASSEEKLTASDAAAGDSFGYRVAGGGDLDGDGFDDVVIAAPFDDDAGANAGSVYVYFGSATGISASSEAKLVASDGAVSDFFGGALAVAGDLDRDGYDDPVVGVEADDDLGASSGSVYVYFGSAAGPTGETKLTASDGATGDGFGGSVSGAGDVDGDGYDDLVVGASGDDDTAAGAGSVYVFYGSASGIASASETKLTASDAAAGDALGFRVSGAGDLDGDGCDDLVAGALYDDDGASDGGPPTCGTARPRGSPAARSSSSPPPTRVPRTASACRWRRPAIWTKTATTTWPSGPRGWTTPARGRGPSTSTSGQPVASTPTAKTGARPRTPRRATPSARPSGARATSTATGARRWSSGCRSTTTAARPRERWWSWASRPASRRRTTPAPTTSASLWRVQAMWTAMATTTSSSVHTATTTAARPAGRPMCTTAAPPASTSAPRPSSRRPTRGPVTASAGRSRVRGMWTATATTTCWWVPRPTPSRAMAAARSMCTWAPRPAWSQAPSRSSRRRMLRWATTMASPSPAPVTSMPMASTTSWSARPSTTTVGLPAARSTCTTAAPPDRRPAPSRSSSPRTAAPTRPLATPWPGSATSTATATAMWAWGRGATPASPARCTSTGAVSRASRAAPR